MMAVASPSEELAAIGYELLIGKYMQLASYTILLFDHALTFSEEVDRIWTQKFTGATVLFLINRYLTPLEFLVVVDALFDPIWSKEACARFVKYEGAGTVALVGICSFIMIIRVYALFGRSVPVLIGLSLLLVLQVAISSVGISTGFAAPLPPMLTGCILTGTSTLLPAVWVMPLITDTCIFILTLWRTQRHLRSVNRTRIVRIFLRDGILYFFVIFLANLMNTLLYFLAPPGLKAIGASFSQLITSVMISRLILNLRGIPLPTNHDRNRTGSNEQLQEFTTIYSQIPDTRFTTFLSLGNLGEEYHDPRPREEEVGFQLGLG